MATSRLRRAFRYPDDDDDTDNAPNEGIDEQEQDKLIAQLASDDAKSIAFYRTFFLAIPAVALVYFALALCVMPYPAGANAAANPFFYMLSFVSLLLSLGSAYDIDSPATEPSASRLFTAAPTTLPPQLAELLRLGRAHITAVNAGLCAVLGLIALASSSDATPSVPISVSVTLVLVVFAIVAVARHELRPVDVAELERNKYTYKGA